MSQSLAQIYLHCVFSTKGRAAFLQDRPFRERVHGYLAGTCRNLDSPSLIVGGVEDHVHVLCRLSKTISVADLIRELKRQSSKWIKAEVPLLSQFSWQKGYGAFSISPSHVEALKKYIANQELHHRRESFQDEFRRLLRKYGVEYFQGLVLGSLTVPRVALRLPWASGCNRFAVRIRHERSSWFFNSLHGSGEPTRRAIAEQPP